MPEYVPITEGDIEAFTEELEDDDTDRDNTLSLMGAWFRPPGASVVWLPWSDREQFTAHEAGSSRRRWHDLIDHHDDLAIELDDVTALFQWMIGLVSGRPTRPSS